MILFLSSKIDRYFLSQQLCYLFVLIYIITTILTVSSFSFDNFIQLEAMRERVKNNKTKHTKKQGSKYEKKSQYLHPNFPSGWQELMYQFTFLEASRYPRYRIGIISRVQKDCSSIIPLVNGFLISSQILLTTLTPIIDSKGIQFHLYDDLIFHPFPYGTLSFQRGVKIKYANNPVKVKDLRSFLNVQNRQNYAVFTLEQPISGQECSFIKLTILSCKSCLLGKEQRQLGIQGYLQRQANGINFLNVFLFGLQSKGRVIQIDHQNSLIYFKIGVEKLQRGCPLFVSNKCIGIYLNSTQDTCIGLLFNQQVVYNIKKLQGSKQTHKIYTQQLSDCNHESIIISSHNYEEQTANFRLLDYSWKEIRGVLNLSNFNHLQYLDLSNNRIQQIRFNTSHINLNYLNLSNNCIRVIDISYLINLKQLKMAQNQLSQIDIKYNVLLKSLNLSDNLISLLSLLENRKIQTLLLSNNLLDKIDLQNNASLKILDISYNILNKLEIKQNIYLVIVILNNNNLKQLNVCHNNLIEQLYLNDNQIQSFIYCQLPRLQRIELRNNRDARKIQIQSDQLKQASFSCFDMCYRQNICQRQILSYIDYQPDYRTHRLLISRNKIQKISIQNWNLTYIDIKFYHNLIALDINSNKISKIQLAHNLLLTKLRANNNLLSSLKVDQNINLKIIQANHNKIIDIDLKYNKNLQQFDLSHNCLIQMDFSFNQNLRIVNVNENSIAKVIFSNNKWLKHLQMQDNLLTEINISQSPKLDSLNLGATTISTTKIHFNHDLIMKLIPRSNDIPIAGLKKSKSQQKSDKIMEQWAQNGSDISLVIIIVCNSSEQQQCRRIIMKLKSLQHIKYFTKEQGQLNQLQNIQLTYNNFIYKMEIIQQ